MRLGEDPYMDVDRRNDILLLIAEARAKEARVNEVRAVIPAWADQPFKSDQANWAASLKAYQAANPIVVKLESRLALEPGPIWKELTAEEKAALYNWTASIEAMYGYVNTYFPTETQKYLPQAVLIAIAIGAFTTPLFLSSDDEGFNLPFKFGPIPLPPQIGPSSRAIAPSVSTFQSQRPSYSASSFSKIPQQSPMSPIQAEVMRPTVSSPPWKSAAPTSAGAIQVSPGFRTFTTPLGPAMPVTASSIQAAATGAPPAPASPHGDRIYPRFRRQ
jgi:hypothetical protein